MLPLEVPKWEASFLPPAGLEGVFCCWKLKPTDPFAQIRTVGAYASICLYPFHLRSATWFHSSYLPQTLCMFLRCSLCDVSPLQSRRRTCAQAFSSSHFTFQYLYFYGRLELFVCVAKLIRNDIVFFLDSVADSTRSVCFSAVCPACSLESTRSEASRCGQFYFCFGTLVFRLYKNLLTFRTEHLVIYLSHLFIYHISIW